MPTGTLSGRGKALWEQIYQHYRSEGLSDGEAAQRAWAAIKAAGWKQNDVGKWIKAERMLLFGFGSSEFVKVAGDARLFKKMLAPIGTWTDPRTGTLDTPLQITQDRVLGWIKNFENGHPDVVPVPIGHAGFDDATKNTGYLKSMWFDPTPVVTETAFWPYGAMYGTIEFTNAEAAKLAEEGSIPAVSIGIDTDYWDPKTGTKLGEAIEHVALTQHPHIQGMTGWETIAAEMGYDTELELIEFGAPTAKESGHKSPPEGYPTSRSDYADPRNYKFPITAQFVQAAVSYFNKAVTSGEYTEGELKFIAKRIARAFRNIRGHDVGPDTQVAKYAGIKTKAEGDSEMSMQVLEKQVADLKVRMEAAEKVAAEKDLELTTQKETLEKEKKDALERAAADKEKVERELLEAKAVNDEHEKSKLAAERKEDERRIDELVGAKREGAKFGLQRTAKPVLMAILTRVKGSKIEVEKDGKKVQVTLEDSLLEFLGSITTGGLVPVEEVVKLEDTQITGGGKKETLVEKARRLKLIPKGDESK